MTISEEYINMCEKAITIQENWIPMLGDRTVIKDKDSVKILSYISQEEEDTACGLRMGSRKMRDNVIVVFCPRQDQLQEMVMNLGVEPHKHCNTLCVLQPFYQFVKYGEGYWHSFNNCPYPHPSMEELWLAFVMKELFGKTWDGKDWG